MTKRDNGLLYRFGMRSLFRSGAALSAILLLVACSTQRSSQAGQPNSVTAHRSVGAFADRHQVEQAIRAEYRKWKGTRHRLGGTGTKGIDCSGFVQTVYRNVFHIDLPRATRYQVKSGRAVRRTELSAGDLVFFRPPSYPRHVGIYLSDNQFVHASKSKGVVISSMNTAYWLNSYWTARRILK